MSIFQEHLDYPNHVVLETNDCLTSTSALPVNMTNIMLPTWDVYTTKNEVTTAEAGHPNAIDVENGFSLTYAGIRRSTRLQHKDEATLTSLSEVISSSTVWTGDAGYLTE